MPYVPPKGKTDFEKIVVDEWITGEIEKEDVFKDVEQKFKNKEGKDDIRKVDQVRFKFKLDGYKYPHYSRKMTLSTSEKSNLFKFLQQIYGDTIVPDIAIDTSKLIGLKVKTMWENNGEYQNMTMIRPLKAPPIIWETEVKNEDIYKGDDFPEPEPKDESPF